MIHRDVSPRTSCSTRTGTPTSRTSGSPRTWPLPTRLDARAPPVPYLSPERARGEPLTPRPTCTASASCCTSPSPGGHPTQRRPGPEDRPVGAVARASYGRRIAVDGSPTARRARCSPPRVDRGCGAHRRRSDRSRGRASATRTRACAPSRRPTPATSSAASARPGAPRPDGRGRDSAVPGRRRPLRAAASPPWCAPVWSRRCGPARSPARTWFVVDMIPGPHPFEELAAALTRIAVDRGPASPKSGAG